LRDAQLDGWLFCDFRHSDPLAWRILKLDPNAHATRRWFYFVPASGEPTKIVHRIEDDRLDALPGRKIIYLRWQELQAALQTALTGAQRVAMQYSPNNAIPYIARVDAGTIELVRSCGVEVVTSADLVQIFEAVWTPAQHATHVEAAEKIYRIIQEAFAEIARYIRANEALTEYTIQQFIWRRFGEEGMHSDAPPIVAVNANSAMPHYLPNADVHAPIKTRRLRAARCLGQAETAGCGLRRFELDRVCGRNHPRRIRAHLPHCERGARRGGGVHS
jgi:Xaa-Pro aminopeptidase